MDITYISEALPYMGLLRPTVYRDYEQPWNDDYFHLGKSTTTTTRSQEQYQQQLRASREKDHCELCRNKKRRSLAAYIRSKSKMNSCNEIHEEEEEDVDGDKTNNIESRDIKNATTITTNTTTAKKTNENTNKPKIKTSRFRFRF